LEFTGRALDLAIDGNGYFVVEKDAERFYTRAGNFKVDDEGFVTTQKGLRVQGFSANGSGALEDLNVNGTSQSNIDTRNVDIAGNLNAGTDTADIGAPSALLDGILGTGADGATSNGATFTDLNDEAEFSTVVDVFDSLGQAHTVTTFFFHTAGNTWEARAYVASEDVDATNAVSGEPREIGRTNMVFNSSGLLTGTPVSIDMVGPGTDVEWNNGSSAADLSIDLTNFTQFSTASNVSSITGDGSGIGAVTSLSIDRDGTVLAILDNGQASAIGTIGMANFSNPEGLVRIGANLLQQTNDSGAPIVGSPNAGTFGAVESGSIELSTVDIASEFVKLITLQRGFQSNSRIITTINQLLNEIIQLV
jgi:flagellar hook protein FlgE